jgi:hypothetical protein
MKYSNKTRGAVFSCYETAKKEKPDLSIKDYDMVYSGKTDLSGSDSYALNELYNVFNIRHPKDFKGRSMSVSDVIDLEGRLYYVDTFGFKRINIDFKLIKKEN